MFTFVQKLNIPYLILKKHTFLKKRQTISKKNHTIFEESFFNLFLLLTKVQMLHPKLVCTKSSIHATKSKNALLKIFH